jgi:DNA-binding winged helix-turn-helix (wHTH) protein
MEEKLSFVLNAPTSFELRSVPSKEGNLFYWVNGPNFSAAFKCFNECLDNCVWYIERQLGLKFKPKELVFDDEGVKYFDGDKVYELKNTAGVMFKYLYSKINRVVSNEELIEHGWGKTYPVDDYSKRLINSHLHTINKFLEKVDLNIMIFRRVREGIILIKV